MKGIVAICGCSLPLFGPGHLLEESRWVYESIVAILFILEMNPEDEAEEDGDNIDLDSQRKGKCVLLKTSTRQTIFLPVVGLVDPDKLKPGDLVGVNKDI